MEKKEIQKLLQPVLFYQIAAKERPGIGWFTQERILVRIFERLPWYDLVNLFGIDGLTRLLRKDVIARIRIGELREKYEFARKVLQGETVSFSGWSPEYREKIRHTLVKKG